MLLGTFSARPLLFRPACRREAKRRRALTAGRASAGVAWYCRNGGWLKTDPYVFEMLWRKPAHLSRLKCHHRAIYRALACWRRRGGSPASGRYCDRRRNGFLAAKETLSGMRRGVWLRVLISIIAATHVQLWRQPSRMCRLQAA